MLSFLQQRLGKSPTKSQKNITRQDSIESAFARVNACNVSKDASATPSLTTATSLTDTSSEPTDGSEKPEIHPQGLGRSGASVDNYDEHIHPNSPFGTKRTLGTNEDNQIKFGETLHEGSKNGSREQLLHQSVQTLDEDWNIGAMPGDDLELSTKDDGGTEKRRSTRSTLLEQVSAVMETTTSVLGKRGREAMEAGMERIHKGDRKRPGRRPANKESASFESPKKRARFSSTHYKKASSPQLSARTGATKKRSKHWVTQGLYVGQSPDFDPRLTESKNKLKKASTKRLTPRKSPVMPLPMFAGERTLALGRDFKLPFDVFSPLPPGQPKPDEWKKTHKSMSRDEISQWTMLTP